MGPAPIESISVTAPPRHPRAAWRTFLSELNPLQYLPVVGTIYRAVTGDRIPDDVREAGSLAVSLLTGGPIGFGISLGATLVERALGIDPETIGARVLTGLGVGTAAAPAAPGSEGVSVVAAPAVGAPAGAGTPDATSAAARPAPARAWSRAELAAYGVTAGEAGELRRGAARGADVLNGLELGRLRALA